MKSLQSKALFLAKKLHEGQFRKSGEPYVTHCIETRKILLSWGVTDDALLAASLAHDLLEDTPISKQELTNELGAEVCFLVEGVTKFKKTTGEGDSFATKQKIASESYLDPRVAVLKLADRLHNMSTLSHLPHEKQLRKADETLHLYAPLAESLGMWQVKRELEDLSFSYLDPATHQKVEQQIETDPRTNPRFQNSLITKIHQKLMKNNVNVIVEIRHNGLWTLMKKRDKAAFSHAGTRRDFLHINDLISVRVICKTKVDCYVALALIHELFQGLVNVDKFDEYIVSPRPNGYSALQTTIETDKGSIEIAFVTVDMEQFNNWGVLTVLQTKNGKRSSYSRKAVFTINDRVWYVPPEATVLDVAYEVNPSLGRSTKSAIVNGRKMALDTVIPNASSVVFRIGTKKPLINHQKLVRLPKSKAQIAAFALQDEWEKMSTKGRSIISKCLETDKRGVFSLSHVPHQELLPLLFENGCMSLSELYYKVGTRHVLPNVISDFLEKRGYIKNNTNRRGIRISGDQKQDKPGILADITHEIAEGGANILYIENTHAHNGSFQTTLLVDGMTESQFYSLQTTLSADTRFSEVVFV